MPLTMDHLVYGAPDVAGAADDLAARLGVRASLGGRHDGAGTYNMLVGLGGEQYLEIIGADPEQPEPSAPRPFGVDALDRPQLVGWALRCHGIDDVIDRTRARGYDPGPAVAMQRTRPDGVTLRWRLTRNAVAGGPIPFLIDWGDTAHPTKTTPDGLRLVDFCIEHPSPAPIQAVLDALEVEVEVHQATRAGLVATIEGSLGVVDLR